jgi:hypothetical protein
MNARAKGCETDFRAGSERGLTQAFSGRDERRCGGGVAGTRDVEVRAGISASGACGNITPYGVMFLWID